MCQLLSEVREAIREIAESFDPELLSASVSQTALADAAAIERMAATIKALAASRAAACGTWRHRGQRSAAEDLAHRTGMSVGAARDSLQTGQRLDRHPDLAAAARQGRLSPTQTAMIADAATADPRSAAPLLDHAVNGSLSELRQECARVKTAACADLERRRQQIHANRRLRSWIDLEGVWHLHASGNPEDGAQVMSALSPIRDELFHQARTADRRDRPDAYAFDALVQLAREVTGTPPTSGQPAGTGPAATGPVGGPAPSEPKSRTRPTRRRRRGPPVKLLLRVDYDTWLRGIPLDGETCELAGYGPVPVSTVRDLLHTGDPFITAILTRGKTLTGVAHLGRQPTAYQRTALEWLYPSCAADGCAAQAHLQSDHRLDWSKTHFTALDLLDRLCAHHHGLKTRGNWALINGTGKRAFVPPDDPRHPGPNRNGAASLEHPARADP